MKVTMEIPIAPPTVLNMPRNPMIEAILPGKRSTQALLAAGFTIPAPIPQNRTVKEITSAGPTCIPALSSKGKPSHKKIVEIPASARPTIMGNRYPHRVRSKLVVTEATITPIDRGVRIMPLIRVER